MTEPVKCDRADGDAERHFDQRCNRDISGRSDAEGCGCIKGGRRNEDRCKTDKAVKRGNKLRHCRHRNALGSEGADSAANGQSAKDHEPAHPLRWRGHGQRRQDGHGHTDHAVKIALPRTFRARQSAQGQNEQHARNQIEQRNQIC